MTALIVSAIALIFTIIGATWKLSSLISPLIEAFQRLDKAVGKLSDTITVHGEKIAVLGERVERTEEDISKIHHQLDNAA